MVRRYSLSIVLPAYNEGRSIERIVLNVDNSVRGILTDYEIIVVDDGSSDRTRAILNRLKKSISKLHVVTHAKNLGYGGALKSGINAAQKELILLMDADGQFSIEALPRFLEKIPSFDAIIGMRKNRQDNLYRRALGRAGNAFLNLMLKQRIVDVNCGFKLFRADDLKSIRLYSSGGLISCEILRKLLARKGRICQIAVDHYSREIGKATGGKLLTVVQFILETPSLFK